MHHVLNSVARDYRIKLAVQKAISLLPGSVAFKLNDALVSLARGSIEDRIDLTARARKAVWNLSLTTKRTGFNLDGGRVLEVGTGWHGVDLLVFYLLGAREITTIDHVRHLKADNVDVALRACLDDETLGLMQPLGLRQDRLANLKSLANSSFDVDDFVQAINVNYLVTSPGNYPHLDLNNEFFDFFYSESVLQRVKPSVLIDFLMSVGHNWMKRNGVFFLRTDQKDINAQEHVDKKLWGLEYLKWSEFWFNAIINNKFAYQNRLRESEFIGALHRAGLYPHYIRSLVRPEDVNLIGDCPQSKRFQGMDQRDLATTASILIGGMSRGSYEREIKERNIEEGTP